MPLMRPKMAYMLCVLTIFLGQDSGHNIHQINRGIVAFEVSCMSPFSNYDTCNGYLCTKR